MARTVAIGIQDFETLITNDYFYVDKTHFIKEWWESGDSVTLITRPRRFGKTLAMSMLECFFSTDYAGRGDLFEGLSVWEEQKYHSLQGTFPVIDLTFANVKENSLAAAKRKINELLVSLYEKNAFLKASGLLGEKELEYYGRVSADMDEVTASLAIHRMADFLSRYYGKKVIILLDEYDTPMQEAYMHGFWNELVGFMRNIFNAAFKTNPHLCRGIMTGITRMSKESIFSDLNNLEVVTTTVGKYGDAFGFTEAEVFAAMDELGRGDRAEVKRWYDGFVFGDRKDIYNPWSILNFLDTGKYAAYWANTSSNGLAGKLIRESEPEVKRSFELLMRGEHIFAEIDEQIVWQHLNQDSDAIFSLLLAAGYLKAVAVDDKPMLQGFGMPVYELALTNFEVRLMFTSMIRGWFRGAWKGEYNGFVRALLAGDRKLMNTYMNKVALATFSYFDSGNHPSESEPERFYHGFVLGLLVDLADRYRVTSNRESGFGRYDVMLEPLGPLEPAIILEFKVREPEEERTLADTADAALVQIRKKRYDQTLMDRGIARERIFAYGFAFEGKTVLIR